MFLGLSKGELRDTEARCEKEGLFKSPDFSHEKVLAVLGGEAVLWDLSLQGPPEMRRQRHAQRILAGLENMRELYLLSEKEELAGNLSPLLASVQH